MGIVIWLSHFNTRSTCLICWKSSNVEAWYRLGRQHMKVYTKDKWRAQIQRIVNLSPLFFLSCTHSYFVFMYPNNFVQCFPHCFCIITPPPFGNKLGGHIGRVEQYWKIELKDNFFFLYKLLVVHVYHGWRRKIRKKKFLCELQCFL